MIYYIAMIFIGIIGVTFLIKGEARISKNKVVKGKAGRLIGVVLVAGVLIDLFALGSMQGVLYMTVVGLVVAIVIGLVKAQPLI
jgi:hypothetical protein